MVTKQFPWKLHEMLEKAELEGKEAIVSWMPSGRAFRVHQPEVFVKDIMTNHFQQSKYKSFQRQLNLWGFSRNSKDTPEPGSYCHPLFVKGRKDLCQEIGRHKIKLNSAKAKEEHKAKLAALPLPELGPTATATIPAKPQGAAFSISSSISSCGSDSSAPQVAVPQQVLSNPQADVVSLLAKLAGGNGTNTSAPSVPAPPAQPANDHISVIVNLVNTLQQASNITNPPQQQQLITTGSAQSDMLLAALIVQAQLSQNKADATALHLKSQTNEIAPASNIFAQADAEILQAMQRKVALEQIFGGGR